MTFVIGKASDRGIGFRLPEAVEVNGVAAAARAQNAYVLDDSLFVELSSPTPPGGEVPSASPG